MSKKVDRTRNVETLAWITDDEAEFWTSSTPTKKDDKSENKSIDGLYFKYENSSEMTEDTKDDLSQLHHEQLANEAKRIEDEAQNKTITEIFEFEDKKRSNDDKDPGVNESFLRKLFEPFQKSKSKENISTHDEDFLQIDEKDIQSVVNENFDEKLRLNNKENLKNKNQDEISLIDKVKTFIDELNEETEVMTGKIDEETFVNRRSRRAKSIPTSNF